MYRYKINVNKENFLKNRYKILDEFPLSIGYNKKNVKAELIDTPAIQGGDSQDNAHYYLERTNSLEEPIDESNFDYILVYRKDKDSSIIRETGYIDIQEGAIYSEVEVLADQLDKDVHAISKMYGILAKYNCLERNAGFRFSKYPVKLRYDDADNLASIMNYKVSFKSPIILVESEDVDYNFLAEKLAGLAIVLVKDDPELFEILPSLLNEEGKKYCVEGLHILYPKQDINDSWTEENCKSSDDADDDQEEVSSEESNLRNAKVVIDNIMHYYQELCYIYNVGDWKDYRYGHDVLLNSIIESQIKTLKTYKKTIDDLARQNSKLKAKNNEIGKLSIEGSPVRAINKTAIATVRSPMFFSGDEQPLYEGEIEDMIISSLQEYRDKYVKDDTRRAHVLDDFLKTNPTSGICKKKAELIAKELHEFENGSSPKTMDKLRKCGFDVKVGNHIKVKWQGNSRYYATISKTPSDENQYKVMIRSLIEKFL